MVGGGWYHMLLLLLIILHSKAKTRFESLRVLIYYFILSCIFMNSFLVQFFVYFI